MVDASTKRLITTIVVGVIWLSLFAFLAFKIIPLRQTLLQTHQTLAKQQESILSLKDKSPEEENLPTAGLIEKYETRKKKLRKEAETCASYYIRHSGDLNDDIFKGPRSQAYQMANEFRSEKNKLSDRAGNLNFLELGPLDDWEEEAKGRPEPDQIDRLEKATALARILIGHPDPQPPGELTHDPSTVIELMHIHEPITPEQPPVPDGELRVVRYRLLPVDITFTTRFKTLGETLDQIVRVSRTTEEPCISVRSVALETPDELRPGIVQVQLGLYIFDFYRPGEPEG